MSTQLEDPEILHRPSHSLGSRKYRIAVFHNIPSGGARRAIYDYMQVLSVSGHTFDVFDYTSSNCGVLPLEEYAGRITHYPFEGSPELSVRLPLLSDFSLAWT